MLDFTGKAKWCVFFSRSTLASLKPYLLTDNTLCTPSHCLTQGCLERTEGHVEGRGVAKIRREALSRAFCSCALINVKRADPTNTPLQILEAADTEEAKDYIKQINAV